MVQRIGQEEVSEVEKEDHDYGSKQDSVKARPYDSISEPKKGTGRHKLSQTRWINSLIPKQTLSIAPTLNIVKN